MWRKACVIALLLTLSACGVVPTASTPPTPIVITQVVTQIVREIVVVTAVIALDAEGTITDPLDREIRPTLIIRCQERELEVYINTGMQPDVEAGNLDGATARLRLDKQQPQTFNMGKSTDGEALFFPSGEAIVRAMLAAERMIFEFTPFSADPAEMTFDLRGIGEANAPVRAACPQTP